MMNKKILGIALGSILILIIFILINNKPKIITSEPSGENIVKVVDAFEFAQLVKDKNNFVVDVHTPEQTHIPETDSIIAYNQISQNLDKLPIDKSTPVLVYCRSGSMSKTAAQEIAGLGYSNVYELAGGTDAYKKQVSSVGISPQTIDLGEVIYGEVANTTYKLINYTDTDLKITRVSTSCTCTKVSVEQDTVKAYQSVDIAVSFDPAVHGDDTDVGDITRTIYIETDNSEFGRITAELTAVVIKNDS